MVEPLIIGSGDWIVKDSTGHIFTGVLIERPPFSLLRDFGGWTPGLVGRPVDAIDISAGAVGVRPAALAWVRQPQHVHLHERVCAVGIEVDFKDKQAARGYFVSLQAGKSDHQFEYWAGGWVSIGSTAGKNIWVVKAEGVADFHFNVELGPGPKEATIHDGDSGEPTLVGKTKLVGGATKKVSLPVTIKFGKGELQVREGQPPIDIEFEAKRHHVDRRRQLRLYDPDLDDADRQLVIPTVGNSDHYGSS